MTPSGSTAASRVPASRRCVFHYELAEVRVHGDYLAATVALYRTSGFEANTDIRYMLVTARRPDRWASTLLHAQYRFHRLGRARRAQGYRVLDTGAGLPAPQLTRR